MEEKSTLQEALDFLQSREKCNLLMVIINIVVFVILEWMGSTTDTMFMLHHGAMYEPLVVERGEYYRLFTCMFLHFGVQHLLYNMLLLIFVGDMLEKAVGKVRYLMIYLGRHSRQSSLYGGGYEDWFLCGLSWGIRSDLCGSWCIGLSGSEEPGPDQSGRDLAFDDYGSTVADRRLHPDGN